MWHFPLMMGEFVYSTEKSNNLPPCAMHRRYRTDDTAEILFTSGTTSRPKGVVITHYNLRFAGYYSAWQCALRDDDVYLTVMPAFHIDCQCTAAMAAFSAGATFVLVEKYSARAFWGQVQNTAPPLPNVFR
ncbi:crotonobetaine/carnitine-CoA ligase [Escherichia coli]|uniref:Crotonobetaine/carnitine-CoA ligase n=1 Tax=Escherichia coli TaxID=562 RepID=A0A2X1PZW5_ECOLX|nr:crotonobetaine/carnitine-CoA ligase [Escherichia coli]